MWIKRVLADELRKLTASFPVVALVGPRQVGKTSLLEHDFPEFRYVSLDTASQAEMAETRPAEFLQRFPPPVIIDEVQYAPALFRHIKAYVDTHRNGPGCDYATRAHYPTYHDYSIGFRCCADVR